MQEHDQMPVQPDAPVQPQTQPNFVTPGYAPIQQQPPQYPQNYAPPQYQQPYQPGYGPQPYQSGYGPQPFNQVVMQTNVIVNSNIKTGPGFLVRAIWYCCVGWWLAGLWMSMAWFLCSIVIGLPLGLMMFNRLPQVLTLRPRSLMTSVKIGPDGTVHVTYGNTPQIAMWIRAIYFVFVGSWVSFLWCGFAYFLCLTILGLPFGIMMFDRLPAVLTLRRN